MLTPRNLSIAYLTTRPDIGREDMDSRTATAVEVEAWLLASAALGTMTGMSYYNENSVAHDAYFYEGMWLSRALAAWDRVRTSATPANVAPIDAWLLAQAQYMATMLHAQISDGFPGRATDDYSTLAGSTGNLMGFWAHEGGPPLYYSVAYHNNRRSHMVMSVLLAGIMFNVPAFLIEVKRYVKEWVRFSVFENGAQGEWARAGNYGEPAQGLIYGSNNIAVALEATARLHAIGDDELLNYSTTAGANGTQSTAPKTVFTACDTHLDIIAGTRIFKTPAGEVMNWYEPVLGVLRVLHWTFYLRPLILLGRGGRICRLLNTDESFGGLWTDSTWPLWSGFDGVYTDCRTGAAPLSLRLV